MTKKRTINEYRQVKDAIYEAPTSHSITKLKTLKKESLGVLLQVHSNLYEGYNEEDRREILSGLETLIVQLDK